MTREQLTQSIFKIAHLRGSFLLRSGQTSSEYFDKYRFEAQPELLKAIGQQMAPLIPKDTEVLAGLEMGGIPIAVSLSFATGLPVVFVRKEAKAYGTCQLAEGLNVEGKKVCVVEDVITTGGQVAVSTGDLRKLGAKIDTVVCAIDRGDNPNKKLDEAGLKLFSLFKKSDFAHFSPTI
jgi:orotate phosphoribosyltransferase